MSFFQVVWERRKNLATRIILSILGLTLLAQLIAGMVGYTGLVTLQEHLHNQAAVRTIDQVNQELRDERQHLEEDAQLFATDQAVALAVNDGQLADLSVSIKPWLERLTTDFVIVKNASGQTLLSSFSSPTIDPSHLFADRLLPTHPWSSVEIDKQGVWVIAEVPIHTDDTIDGAIIVGRQLDLIKLRAHAGLLTSELAIYADGKMVDTTASSEPLYSTFARNYSTEQSGDPTNPEPQTILDHTASIDIGYNGAIVATSGSIASDGLIERWRQSMILISLGVTVVVVIAGTLMAKQAADAFRTIAQAGQELLQGNYSQHIKLSGIKEVDYAATTINHLTETIQEQLDNMRHQAYYDGLTDLPNRPMLLEHIRQALARAGRYGYNVAICYLDLDNFKLVNDSMGHQAGDELLAAVARRIRLQLRDGDTAARIGGDEFAILLEPIYDAKDAYVVAERVQEALQKPLSIGPREVFTSASIGIALASPELSGPDDLLRQADLAMYRAKAEGKARYATFNPALNEKINERLELEMALRHAIERGEMSLVYQPVVNLTTMEAVDFEALLRWNHPKYGLVPPPEFIPMAEDTGLIGPMGKWVLSQACANARACQSSIGNHYRLRISVNLSPQQLLDPDLVGYVEQTLRQHELEPSVLQLEITEGVMIRETKAALTALNRLKELGVRLAIDDFGVGYSSLAYLKHLPIDTLKIDRTFVAHLGVDPRDGAIVEAVVAFARAMNMVVTGEGIEDAEQLRLLKQLGCHQGQGYYLSAPLEPAAFHAFVKRLSSQVSCIRTN